MPLGPPVFARVCATPTYKNTGGHSDTVSHALYLFALETFDHHGIIDPMVVYILSGANEKCNYGTFFGLL